MHQVSVIVVSNGRPQALMRCLTGVSQLFHKNFEIVVVCDGAAARALAARNDAAQIKTVEFEEPNISAARNLGIAHAGGEICAFIDDDAVPEPTWLNALTAPFSEPDISATGGYVIGRNGVSYQWKASMTDPAARVVHCDPSAALPEGYVWRTEGTNMAFRRDALVEIGGFDEAIHFYLDETDVNLRLRGRTVIVPDALVHHGYAASARRRGDRVPTDLTQIGASMAHFLKQHAPEQMESRLKDFHQEQWARLIRHMIAGRLEPRDVRRLLNTLENGAEQGATRVAKFKSFERSPPLFQRYVSAVEACPKVILAAGNEREQALQEAVRQSKAGSRVSVVIFHSDARFLQVSFQPEGFWLHEGGRFGRGVRSETLLQFAKLQSRFERERARIAEQRGLIDHQ